jgi:hypothetical protein
MKAVRMVDANAVNSEYRRNGSGTARLSLFRRKDLVERMDLHSVEYPEDRIGIFFDKLFGFFSRACFDDNQAAYMVDHWTCENDPTTLVPVLYFFNMGGAEDLSPSLAFWSIEPEDDELHCHVV